MQIVGKTVLVTGSSHRLGKAILMKLAHEGANVVVHYNSSAQAAAQTVDEAKALGVDAIAIQCDIAKLEEVQRMRHVVEAHFGGVDILVNNAVFFGQHPVPTDDYTVWHGVTGVTINGSFYVSNEFAPSMLARGGGIIINMIDAAAWEPWPNLTAYCVAKTGLVAMTKMLALELAPSIRVNAIAPGPVLPPRHYDETLLAKIADPTLLKRWGSVEDVTRAVKYLIEADYVTAEVTGVNGGAPYGLHMGVTVD
jgi:NAD(P)-dependent dehydrogenase (short-subunit alcohol dehydrogenase family)